MKAYSDYALTPLPWLPQIPAHWALIRNKNIFQEAKDVVGDNADEYSLLSLTTKGIILRDVESGKGKFPKDFNTYKVVRQGDMAFCLFDIDETPRTVGLSPYDGMLTGAYTIFHVVNIHPRYVYYYYLSLDNVKAMRPLYSGLRKTISAGTFLATKLPVPPRAEQEQIVRFLDWKVSSINKLIRVKRQQIAKLEELKKISVNDAVTGKTQNSAEFNDSGFDYIGAVPSHWQVVKLEWLVLSPLQYGANATGIEFDESLPRYIRITDITIDNKLKDSGKQSLSDDLASPYILDDKDILFVRSGATVGKSFLYKKEYGVSAFAGYLIRAKVNSEIAFPEFVYAVTLSQFYELWKDRIFIQSTIQNISAEQYNNLPVPIPPLEEQTKILQSIAEKVKGIETLIANFKRHISGLMDLKNRLIADVVTGKIDVRDVAIPEYEFVGEEADADADGRGEEEQTGGIDE